MKKITKRIICGIVTIALVLSLIPNIGDLKIVEASGYNVDDAVNYALQYTNSSGGEDTGSYNKAYSIFSGNDCSNFVSQCLVAGGLPTDANWGPYTRAWKRADYLFEWFKSKPEYSGLIVRNPSESDVQKGDILFYVWGTEVSGKTPNDIDHAGICTDKSGNTPLVSAHTSNRKNYSSWRMGAGAVYVVKLHELYIKHPGTVMDFGPTFDATINDVNGQSLRRMDDGYIRMGDYTYTDKDSFIWRFVRESDGTYHISSLKDGYVIDVKDAGTTNSTPAWMYQYNASSAQRYYICDIGGGYYVLEPVCARGSVLDRGGLVGENLHLWNYESGNNNQKFIFGMGDALDMGWSFDATIELSKNGECLYQNSDGDILIKEYNDEELNRYMWHFEKYPDGTYWISSWNDKKCFDVSGGGNATQTNVLTYTSNSSKAQKWEMFDMGNGTVVLEPRCAPGRALDAGATHGSAYIWPYEEGNTNQLFVINKYTGDGITTARGTLNGHEYIVYKDSLTALEARMKEGDGYHLATITSADEYNFIMSLTKKISKQPEGYWLGANDNIKESVFVWETGEPFVYDLWPSGQPDNNGGDLGDENYFGIWSSGIWNDFPEAYKLGYVLEKDPPASTASGTLGNHEYMISAAYMTRAEAEKYQTDGWYLATITSSAERDYVVSLINGLTEKNLNGYWLGGNDVGHEGTFVWENGETFDYAPWEGGNPNNENRLGQDENYLSLLNNGNFNDSNESYCLGYILERDPNSSVIKAKSIELTSNRDETMDAYEDDTFQLTAEVLPEEASDKTVTWSCSDTDYAIVDDNGKVTVKSTVPDAVKTIIITATNSDGTVSASYSFVVCPRSSCDHVWDDGKIIKDATCSEYGEKKYTCSKCETTKIETIGLKAHTPVDDDEVLATCDTEGKTKGSHCLICGKVLSEQTSIPALGHQFGNYIPNNDETCIANGTATAICEKCGKTDSIIIENSATGVHTWGEYEITKPATCSEIGIKTRKCLNCNETSSLGIAKAAHNYEGLVSKEPTCTELGTITYTCENCGDNYEEDIEPLGHIEVVDPEVAPTNNSTGLTEGSHCSRCGTVLIEQQVIPKIEECTDHVWGEYEVTTAPTCTAVGVKTRYCQVCGKKSTLGIPIVDHNYVEEVQKESTCGEAGILKKTCSMCGDEKYEAIEKKTHTIVVDSAVAATTTSTGLTEGSHCSLCGTVIKAQEVIPILPDDSYKENNNPDENKQDNDDKINQNNDQTNNPDDNNANTDSSNSNNANTDSSNGSQADGTAGNNSNHYSSEWVDGKWYDANGNQTYEGTLQWKSNSVGWWVEDSAGWYPQNAWQKIDGVWYYFKPDGYMASGEYYNGYWFNGNGSWDSTYKLSWKSNSTGWWVEDISGWWPSSSWLKIDGSWYYFNGSGYMVTSQYVDGYWIGANGVCQ